LTAATLAAGAAVLGLGAANADHIDRVRSRAQLVADQVSSLEHKLASLRSQRRRLAESIEATDRQIGLMELERHESELAYRAALDDYIARAVDVYKSPSPGMNVELLLSARDVNELVALTHLTNSSARAARASLNALERIRSAAEDTQSEIDARKQTLLRRTAALDDVLADIEATLADRRLAYRELSERIMELEAAARREAARLAAAGVTAGPASPNGKIAAGIPPGFTPTGVTFEGIASWYGPGFEGQTTANGDIFDPDKFTAASRDLPLGSWLYVEHENRGVVVYVNDRGPYIEGRVLDLSQAAAEAIGITGLGWIRAEVLVKV
jgi:rare lipoprotein A (peptidoglycan hydrolase)